MTSVWPHQIKIRNGCDRQLIRWLQFHQPHKSTHLSVYCSSTFIGAVSSLVASVLILVAKGYKEFIYRLISYMAISALGLCLAELANNFENDYNTRSDVSMSTNLLVLYLIYVYVYCFLLCWLGLYLFLLAVFRHQLKKTKHEAIGLVTVLVTPLTFLWVFPWKTKSGNMCDDTNSLNEVKFVLFITFISYTSLEQC